jgi:hypothetical protein
MDLHFSPPRAAPRRRLARPIGAARAGLRPGSLASANIGTIRPSFSPNRAGRES